MSIHACLSTCGNDSDTESCSTEVMNMFQCCESLRQHNCLETYNHWRVVTKLPKKVFTYYYGWSFASNIFSAKFPQLCEEMTFQAGSSYNSKFVWKRPTTQESCARICMYGIAPLLEWITVDDLIRILTLIFLEYNVIVIGAEVEPIVRTVSSFFHLIFPFAWMFPILTIVPDSFIEILESPIPYIDGVFKNDVSMKKFFELDESENILIIDIDQKEIKWPKKKHPKIACHNLYLNELKKFCTTSKKVVKSTYEKQSNVLVISGKGEKNKFHLNQQQAQFFMKKALSKIGSKKNYYFDQDRIEDVINCIFKLNQNIFTSKVSPSIVTNVSISKNDCKAVGSMMVNDIYLSQFDDHKNNLPFLTEFMKTQMFISFREQMCRQKTDEQDKIINHYE